MARRSETPLSDLALVPFLTALTSPALLLPTSPLLDALDARDGRDPVEHHRRHDDDDDDDDDREHRTPAKKRRVDTAADGRAVAVAVAIEVERLAHPRPRRQTSGGIRTATKDKLLPWLHTLEPAFANEAWSELRLRVAGAAPGPGLGIRATASEAEAAGATEDGTLAAEMDLLDEDDQLQLLSTLLDLLHASAIAPDPSRPAPPSTIALQTFSITPTLLPTRSHFVIILSNHTRPPLRSESSPFLHARENPPTPTPPPPPAAPATLAVRPGLVRRTSDWQQSQPDLRKYLASLGDSQMAKRIRSFNWAASPLGSVDTWTPELKAMVSSIMASPFRESLLIGDEHVMIYNDHYIEAAGAKHPALLGRPGHLGWAEIWDEIDPIAKMVMRGETFYAVDHLLPMNRTTNGLPGTDLEETYHTFSYTPFRANDGTVLGFMNLSFETTERVIAARRLTSIRDLVANTAWSRTIPDFCSAALACFATNPYDLPMAALYTAEVVDNTKITKRRVLGEREAKYRNTRIVLQCQGSIGIPTGHPFAPETQMVDLQDLTLPLSHRSASSSSNIAHSDSRTPGWSWPFEEACMSLKPVFVDRLGELASGLEERGWGEKPSQAIVIPLAGEAGQLIPAGVLVFGLSPRCKFDDAYETFVKLVGHHVAIGLLGVANAEADAKRANELIALDKVKTSFLASTSHELRTPLSLILGPLGDVLEDKDLAPVNRDRLAVVKKHANRLLAMVNKLLDFSSLEGGRSQVIYRPVKIGQVTRNLATLFRDGIVRENVEYIINCEDDAAGWMPVYLSIDFWEKVVYNLVGNAFKYCPSGTIEVLLKATRAEVVFSVRDTGVGIPEEELSLIFERFHRVKATSHSTPGTGIGLALTLEVVKALGGQMEVTSELGKGSTFTVRLPRGFTHLKAEQVVHEPEDIETTTRPSPRKITSLSEVTSWREEMAHAEEKALSSGEGAGTTSSSDDVLVTADLFDFKNSVVLLVDDSDDLRDYMAHVLSKVCTVKAVSDGQEALEYALKNPPAIVVSDISMPRLDGRGLLTALRSNPSTSSIPVIFVSAMAGVEARAEALESGADDYLVKPFQTRVGLPISRVRDRTKALEENEIKYRELADRYSTLSLLSPVGIFLTDAAGQFTYANPRFYEISGQPPESDLSMWRDFVEAEDLPKVEAFWASAIDVGTSPTSSLGRLELRYKGGVWVQFELRGFRGVHDEAGFVGCITDLSVQKRLELLHIQTVEQRMADAEKSRRLQEEFIDMTSHELRNPLSGVWQNAEVLGVSLEHVIDFIEDVKSGDTPDEETIDSLLEEMAENQDAVDSILVCARQQGRIADDILDVSKLNMSLVDINLATFDIVLKVREVLRLFEAYASLASFLFSDFRLPPNSCTSDCTHKKIHLSVDVSPSLQSLSATQIHADASRLAQVLINLLANAVKYTSESPTRAITVHIEAFNTEEPPVRENSHRVFQPTALLEPNDDKVWVVLGVQDSGKGLTSEELKKLFARFSQANPKSDQYGGSGLGLYISKKLVGLHGGFIEVESSPGVGSTFRIAIPSKRMPNVASGALGGGELPSAGSLHHPSTSQSSRGKRPSKRKSMDTAGGSSSSGLTSAPAKTDAPTGTVEEEVKPAKVHVLDNIINQKVLTRQLRMQDYDVTVADNGREGLNLLLAEKVKVGTKNDKGEEYVPISIVLMDIEMPVLTGLEAIRELRELEKSGTIPKHYNVVAVTGNARQGQVEEFRASGFDDVAIKPYRIAALVETIQKLSI
ncbi:hypothetical protein MNV49_006453 [Pseudohyphozyma bogoriensis]|nr:hypothetical protein MNV49_006453 [Pseudohyphozyma bogoriensis]